MATTAPIIRHNPTGPHGAIGRRLKLLRLRQGWQLRYAASRIGISESYLCKIEQGHRAPNRLILERLAVLYHVTPEQILVGKSTIRRLGEPNDIEEFFPLNDALTA